jgi:competence protein ComEC
MHCPTRLPFIAVALALSLALLAGASVAHAGAADKRLDIYWIDVEGGAATLIVTPAGESVLVDAGNPGGRDSQRIHKVATEVAKLKKLDHVVVTHLHADHFGGVAELAELMPVRTLYEGGIDSAPEKERSNANVQKFRDAKVTKRVRLQPGQRLPVRGVTLLVHGVRGQFDNLGKGGAAARGARKNVACEGATQKDPDLSDNANSVVLSLQYKAFKFFDGGDLTWNMEEKLACPSIRVPEVDVFQSTHHGLDQSNNPVVVRALSPRVAVFNNGPRKGAQPASFATIKGVPGLEAIYQVHKNLVNAESNTAPEMIANVPDRDQCQGNHLELSVDPSGKSYTVSVPSTGHEKTFETKVAKAP